MMKPEKTTFFLKRLYTNILDWEHWPISFHKIPIGFVWLWCALRSRSLWFFSSSNPTLEFGGFEGERKGEMYGQMPPSFYPKTTYIQPSFSLDQVLQIIEAEGFEFPFAVKPDIGMKGLLFRRIDSAAKLAEYHKNCPVDYIIQEWVDLPIELSVFYIRHPNSTKGQITGMTWKEPIEVVGNGRSSLLYLIKTTPRAAERLHELSTKHADNLQKIVPNGEKYLLTLAANRQRGARLHNMKHEIDANLTQIFDQISLYKGQFYWGRFDLKCSSIEDLRQGKNFKILEFNGAGAAPNHIYHNNLSMRQAWSDVSKHWYSLFEISQYNHNNGIKYWPFFKGWYYLSTSKKHFQLLEKLDNEI